MTRKVSLIKNLDWWTIFIYVLLVFLGWINIYAAVYNEEHQSIFDISQRYGKQLMWIGAAFFLAMVILIIEGKFFSAFAYPTYLVMIFLLVAVLIFGREVNGARSWFEIGGIRLQPAEFAKFATCLAISRYISQFNFKIHKFKSLVVAGVILFTPAVLIILQRDAGSALVYVVFILVLYREGLSGIVLFVGFLSAVLFIVTLLLAKLYVLLMILGFSFVCLKFMGLRFKQIIIGLSALFIGFGLVWGVVKALQLDVSTYMILVISVSLNIVPFLYYIYRERLKNVIWVLLIAVGSLFLTFSVSYLFENVLESHQQERINDLLGIESDPSGAGYNVAQSKIAIGSGGFSGKGFLNGTQTKFKFVPEQSTDFIFCTVGEEWGFIGSTAVLSLLLLLIIRLLFLAERQRSPFSRIYGYGVACILFFHMAINVGMTIGLAPVIGIPLPFFSYGGSSLWAFTILLFVFLRLDANRMELLR
ncbi:rod shape-determining protein RodA [Labilibaculum sp. A4]|uniref:Cell wall polymerase n=1 Tax=Labilibaculum euxinus TaxID=2686357 RepID=A0A425YCV5_9BACT|nr:rod shape-determining protein RodA [Labilibaculum euxinus]MDQ1769899.1 rod shape-determining protein RodA [Labilibaculum euxinus]MUP37883.1 rod shape-determining protein RodA [Labilibaculum euxinus]MVB07088.1 rod shape-determining protein RodA [Labilibaculum euxinus]MWN76454.1 rod shape-determining protein RodA [Labilibaculum euxinus]